jgi:hypothetical protein
MMRLEDQAFKLLLTQHTRKVIKELYRSHILLYVNLSKVDIHPFGRTLSRSSRCSSLPSDISAVPTSIPSEGYQDPRDQSRKIT